MKISKMGFIIEDEVVEAEKEISAIIDRLLDKFEDAPIFELRALGFQLCNWISFLMSERILRLTVKLIGKKEK